MMIHNCMALTENYISISSLFARKKWEKLSVVIEMSHRKSREMGKFMQRAAICFSFAPTKSNLWHKLFFAVSVAHWNYKTQMPVVLWYKAIWLAKTHHRVEWLSVWRETAKTKKIANRISSASAIQFTKHVNRENRKQHFGKLLKNKSTSLEIKRKRREAAGRRRGKQKEECLI